MGTGDKIVFNFLSGNRTRMEQDIGAISQTEPQTADLLPTISENDYECPLQTTLEASYCFVSGCRGS
jgi:hypothetical protein